MYSSRFVHEQLTSRRTRGDAARRSSSGSPHAPEFSADSRRWGHARDANDGVTFSPLRNRAATSARAGSIFSSAARAASRERRGPSATCEPARAPGYRGDLATRWGSLSLPRLPARRHHGARLRAALSSGARMIAALGSCGSPRPSPLHSRTLPLQPVQLVLPALLAPPRAESHLTSRPSLRPPRSAAGASARRVRAATRARSSPSSRRPTGRPLDDDEDEHHTREQEAGDFGHCIGRCGARRGCRERRGGCVLLSASRPSCGASLAQ